MSTELIVLRGRVYQVEFEYEPVIGNGFDEQYFPEDYEIVSVVRQVSMSGVGNVDLTDQFTKQEIVEAIKRVGMV